MIDVHRCRRAGKAAIFDVDLAVSVGVHCRFRGEEVAAGQGNIILTGSPADVNTLDIFLALNGLPVAVGQIDRHGMVGVPLPPHAEIIKVVGRDRDILGKEFTVSGLRTGAAAKLKGIHFQVALTAGNICAVAINGQIVRHMTMGHGTDVGVRLADNGDGLAAVRVRLIRRC